MYIMQKNNFTYTKIISYTKKCTKNLQRRQKRIKVNLFKYVRNFNE